MNAAALRMRCRLTRAAVDLGEYRVLLDKKASEYVVARNWSVGPRCRGAWVLYRSPLDSVAAVRLDASNSTISGLLDRLALHLIGESPLRPLP